MSTPPLTTRRWSLSNHSGDESYDADDAREGADDLLPRPLGHDHPLLSSTLSENGLEGSIDVDAEEGYEQTWSTDKFLISRLPHPPTTILLDLRTYQSTLKHELSELINEDYEEFIGMGMGLRGEGGRLDFVKEGVEELGGDVKVSFDVVVREIRNGWEPWEKGERFGSHRDPQEHLRYKYCSRERSGLVGSSK
jgi:hypothetical protein